MIVLIMLSGWFDRSDKFCHGADRVFSWLALLTQSAVGSDNFSSKTQTLSCGTSNRLGGTIEFLGTRTSFPSNAEIYGEGEPADYFYKVLSGTVRTYKVLVDGRRQIGGFYLPGEMLGVEVGAEHTFSAEAVTALLLSNRT
jgi:hypothetical protein